MSPHQNAHNDKVSYKADGQGMEAVTMVREARVDIFIFLRHGFTSSDDPSHQFPPPPPVGVSAITPKRVTR